MSKDDAKDSPEQKEPSTDQNMPNLSSFVPTSFSSVWSILNSSFSLTVQLMNLVNKTTEQTQKTVTSSLSYATESGKTMFNKFAGEVKDIFGPDDEVDRPSMLKLDFETLKANFDLSESDSLKGSFICEMQQIYNSVENEFSPIVQMSFPIMVYITNEVLCFILEYQGKEYPTKLQSKEISSLALDDDERLVLQLTENRKVVFRSFGDIDFQHTAFKLVQELISN